MIFCDTSTLAKYYVPEAESAAVRVRLDAEDQVVFSELARGELMAVFHRRLREQTWSRREFEAVTRQFIKDEVSGYWSWRLLDSVIVDEAVKIHSMLPETIFLRTADCLHLVTPCIMVLQRFIPMMFIKSGLHPLWDLWRPVSPELR